MDKINKRVDFAKELVLKQSELFAANFGNVESQWKPDASRVTEIDLKISEELESAIKANFPEDDYCSEEAPDKEAVQQLDAEFAWVVDPIDGTNNFALGIPMCGISVGILRDGNPCYGVIFDFGRKTLLHGGPSFGIFAGDQQLPPVEDKPIHQQSLFSLPLPQDPECRGKLNDFIFNYRVRSFGSGTLSLAYTSLGILDGVFDYRSKVWDIAASAALLEATGRKQTFLRYNPFPLKEFSANAPLCPYFAGTTDFCDRIANALGRKAVASQSS